MTSDWFFTIRSLLSINKDISQETIMRSSIYNIHKKIGGFEKKKAKTMETMDGCGCLKGG